MKKTFILGLAVLLLAGLLLTACHSNGGGNEDDSRTSQTGNENGEGEIVGDFSLTVSVFDNAGKWINLDFQRENLTRGFWDILYFNDESIETDESYPEKRIFIVNDQAKFDTIFNEFPPGVNFEKEMILLRGNTSINIATPVVIDKIKLENERLNIYLKYVRLAPPGEPEPPNASSPQMRWLVVKMDKLDIDTVDFIWSSSN